MLKNPVCRNLVCLLPAFFCTCLTAQAPDTASVEVAVVKPHPPSVTHNNFSFAKNRFQLEDQPLLKLIAFAYSLNPRQILGAPDWVENNHWDMEGKTNLTEDATFPQEQQIIRQLLAERFGLQFHEGAREMPAYALRAVKSQSTLAVAADPAAQPVEWTQGHDGVRIENYRSNSMTDFLTYKRLFMDRPLVDQTGLAGRYDFKLTYSYGDAPATEANTPPTMFTAIKEQLGLKFEPVRTSVNIIVIDHVGKPTAN